MNAINFTAYTNDASQLEAIKAFMKALNIKFKIKEEETPYDKKFVEMVLNADQEIKTGKSSKISSSDLDNLWK